MIMISLGYHNEKDLHVAIKKNLIAGVSTAAKKNKQNTNAPVERPRDIAQAQPVSNTISMLFTDVKGPITPVGTKEGKVYAQSFIEGDTNFYAVAILGTGVSVLKTADICWKMFCRRKE